MAQVEEVPGAISQGRTRPEACENVIDALRLMLKPETPPDRRPQPRAALSPAGIVKRRALERHLRGHGAEVLDQGAKHTKWRGPTGGALHHAAPQRDRSRRRGRHLRAARRSNAAQPALIPHRRRDRRLKAITTPTRRRASPDLRAAPGAGRSGHAREGVTRPAPPQNPQSRGLGASATPEGASRAQPSRSAHDGEPDRYDIAALPLFVERFARPGVGLPVRTTTLGSMVAGRRGGRAAAVGARHAPRGRGGVGMACERHDELLSAGYACRSH